MKRLFLVLLVMASCCSGASSLTQYGITWTFDANETTGQFANGVTICTECHKLMHNKRDK